MCENTIYYLENGLSECAHGNTIYYLENGLSECVCVRNILVRGLQFGLAVCLGVCEKYFGVRITIWFDVRITIWFDVRITIWFGCLSWLR